MNLENQRVLGTLLVVASALAFSLAGVWTKSIEASVWVVLCWRGLIGGILIAIYVVVRGEERFHLGWRGWLLACIGSLSSIAFIAAFRNGYVANVSPIYATSPFVAAALAWILMREKSELLTLIAGAFSVLGVAIMVIGGMDQFGSLGDGLAMLMTLGMSLYLVLIRAFKTVPVVWAGGMSALLLIIPGFVVADSFAVSSRDLIYLIGFGTSFAIAAVLLTEGTRLIPAAQAGLFGTAEVPFATLLAWFVLAELPPWQSFAGGGVILFAVLWHGALDLRGKRSDSGKSEVCGLTAEPEVR